jgi:hypothetical protein
MRGRVGCGIAPDRARSRRQPAAPLYLRPPDVTMKRQAVCAAGRWSRVAPLPAGAAEPLALLHAACFPEDPWDAEALARSSR